MQRRNYDIFYLRIKFIIYDYELYYFEKKPDGPFIPEAGTTFDNSFFNNSFGFLRQFKNRSFLDPVFIHVTGRSQN